MAEEDKGAGSDKNRRPEEAPVSRPQPVTPPAAAPGWVVPPNLRRAPVIPGTSPLGPAARAPAPTPPPPAAGAPPPGPSATPSAPDAERPAGAVEPHLEDRAEPPVLDERARAEEAHEPRLGTSDADADAEAVTESAPPASAPAIPAAEEKSRRWGRISPPLMARAAERVGGEEKSRGRGAWVLVAVLVLLVGGVWLWRQGRLEPALAPLQALVAKIMPGSASETSTSTPAASGASAPAAATPGAGGTATATAAGQPADNGAMIQEIKQLLAKLDLAPGPIDATLDPATEDAIRSYQQMAGMPVDGQPSEALLQDLRAVVADQQSAGG
jgi:Putative peptidoglycan binding domain